METKFRDVNTNLKIVTQKYKVGLYVAIYDNDTGRLIDQFGVDKNEEDFHKILREKYKDNLIN